MPRIPVHTVDSAPEASRDALKVLEAKYGKVLNIHGERAHSPAVLLSYAALQDVIRKHATLDGRVRGEADFDPALDALLKLARAYTANVGHTDDDTWQAASSAGWSDEQLTELSIHVTLNLFTNYFNHHVHTELDVREAPRV